MDVAIMSLQRLAASSGQRRRGRPPAWMASLRPDAPKRLDARRVARTSQRTSLPEIPAYGRDNWLWNHRTAIAFPCKLR